MGCDFSVPPPPVGTGLSCCEAFPDGYQDVTPKEHHNGPDYLKGCTLVKMCLKKGQKDHPHDHPVHYMYILKGGKVRITGSPAGPGETIEKEMPTGVGIVMPPGPHVVENIGDDDFEVLFLEVTGEQISDTPEGHICPQVTDECSYKTLAEDDDWMVVKMDIEPGQEDHPHSHKMHVVYIIDGEELSVWGGKDKEGDPLVIPVGPGAILPVPDGFHIVKNSGSKPVSAVYFERKK